MVGKKPARELSRSQLYRRAAQYRQQLSDHEFGKTDAFIAASIVGGALATAVAIRAHRKHAGETLVDATGKRVSIHAGPAQYMKDTASWVDSDGEAASFPEGSPEADRLHHVNPNDDASMFMQERGGKTTYVLRAGLVESPAYWDRIRRGADIALRALHIRPAAAQPPVPPSEA